jgi:hypothetical protein
MASREEPGTRSQSSASSRGLIIAAFEGAQQPTHELDVPL